MLCAEAEKPGCAASANSAPLRSLVDLREVVYEAGTKTYVLSGGPSWSGLCAPSSRRTYSAGVRKQERVLLRGQSAVKPFSEAVCTAVAARWVKMHSLGGIVLMPSSVPCWHPSGALIYIYSISKGRNPTFPAAWGCACAGLCASATNHAFHAAFAARNPGVWSISIGATRGKLLTPLENYQKYGCPSKTHTVTESVI